jgi:FixJ family two-component response regulator
MAPEIVPVAYVIDDDPDVCDSIVALLDSVDIPARTFSSAQEFLAVYDRSLPGCLVLDVRLKGMSGLELQERLRGDGLTMPVIMISSYKDVPIAVRAMKGGALDFLIKPVDDQVLIEHIQAAINLDVQRRKDEMHVREIRERYDSLTDREMEVMDVVVVGATSKKTGGQLGITHKTVDAHRAKIMKKMQATSVAHLIYLAHILKLDVLKNIPPGAGFEG